MPQTYNLFVQSICLVHLRSVFIAFVRLNEACLKVKFAELKLPPIFNAFVLHVFFSANTISSINVLPSGVSHTCSIALKTMFSILNPVLYKSKYEKVVCLSR